MGSSRNLTARCTRAVKFILAKLENSEGGIEKAEQTRTVLENIKENVRQMPILALQDSNLDDIVLTIYSLFHNSWKPQELCVEV